MGLLYDTNRTSLLFCELVNRWKNWVVGHYQRPNQTYLFAVLFDILHALKGRGAYYVQTDV